MKKGSGLTVVLPLAVALVGIGMFSARADGLNRNWVPAAAKWVVHVDMERLMKSETGGYLFEPASDPQVQAKLEVARRLLGIDPLKDLASVTLYGLKPGDREVVAIVKGNLDPAAVETFLKAGEGYEALSCGKHAVHKWLDKNRGNRPGYIAFPMDRAAVMAGSIESLQTALDVLDGKGETIAKGSALAEFEGPADALITAAGVKFAESPQPAQGGQPSMFQNMDSFSLAVWETAGTVSLALKLSVNPPENAAQVEQVIRGMIAFALLSREQNPGMTAIAQSCTVESKAGVVSVKFSHPAKALGELIKAARAKKPGQAENAGETEKPADAAPAQP